MKQTITIKNLTQGQLAIHVTGYASIILNQSQSYVFNSAEEYKPYMKCCSNWMSSGALLVEAKEVVAPAVIKEVKDVKKEEVKKEIKEVKKEEAKKEEKPVK